MGITSHVIALTYLDALVLLRDKVGIYICHTV